jgi:hypothetical protein
MAVGKITLYRVTSAGQTISNVPAVEKIEFNIAKDTEVENNFVTQCDIVPSEAIGDNQSVGQEFSNKQPLGRFEKLYTLTGFLSKIQGTFNDGQHATVNILEKWESEDKVNAIFPEGRFGIQIDDMRDYDIIPTEASSNDAKGLMMKNIQWGLNWIRKPPQATFIIPLTFSRGDGT